MSYELPPFYLQTEELEGQEHDHSITSKINLVDLAGSERQSQAQTSGERLRVRYVGLSAKVTILIIVLTSLMKRIRDLRMY